MLIPDINVWVSLTISEHEHHESSVAWFDTVRHRGSVRFCRTTQQGLLRLLTNPSVLTYYGNEPLTNAAAWQVYEQLSRDDRVGDFAVEPESLEQIWRRLSSKATASPKMWTDTYLAAFAIAASATFITFDKAFAEFPALDLQLIG